MFDENIPQKWEGKFEGLQQVILVGLRSSTSWEPTLKFLDKLIVHKDSLIIGMGDSRVLTALLANMPRFLHHLSEESVTPEIENTAMALSQLAEDSGKSALAKLLVSFAKDDLDLSLISLISLFHVSRMHFSQSIRHKLWYYF